MVWFSCHRSLWQPVTNQKWKRGNSLSSFPLSRSLALGSEEQADCLFLSFCGLQPLRAARRRHSPPQKGKPDSEPHGLLGSARPRRGGGPAGGGGAFPMTSGRPRRCGPRPARPGPALPSVPPARHGGAGTGRRGEAGAADESRDGRGVLRGENLHRAEVHGAQRGCRLLLLFLPGHDRWVPARRGPALPALPRSPGSVPPAPLSLHSVLGLAVPAWLCCRCPVPPACGCLELVLPGGLAGVWWSTALLVVLPPKPLCSSSWNCTVTVLFLCGGDLFCVVLVLVATGGGLAVAHRCASRENCLYFKVLLDFTKTPSSSIFPDRKTLNLVLMHFDGVKSRHHLL